MVAFFLGNQLLPPIMGGSTFSVGGSTQSVTMRGNYADVRCRGFMFFFEVKWSLDFYRGVKRNPQ